MELALHSCPFSAEELRMSGATYPLPHTPLWRGEVQRYLCLYLEWTVRHCTSKHPLKIATLITAWGEVL